MTVSRRIQGWIFAPSRIVVYPIARAWLRGYFGPRSSSPSSFGFLVAPEPSARFLASVARPSVWHVLSPIMASQGHSLGPSSPSPFDPASKQTNRLLSLSSSLHRFENPPNLKLPGFSFSCRMTPEHQISINRGIKTCFPLSRLSLHRSQKYPPKVSGLLFPRLW